jgi:lysophospholipase L1-like esterase
VRNIPGMNCRTLRSALIAGTVAVCCIATGTAADAATAAHSPSPARTTQSPSWHGRPGGNDYDYYLALGDSLAWGYQPNSAGVGVKTGHGYADDLAAYLRQHGDRDLKYVNLSCPGETTGTMLDGGCPDLAGSGQSYAVQEAAAIAFLKAHRHSRILVTLDIGANNIDSCVDSDGALDATCIEEGISEAGTQLPEILAGLKAAAGSQVSFVGMNYYDPFLADWLTGSAGQSVAEESVGVSADFNGVLDEAFAAYHVPVADVSSAFKTADFTDTTSLDGTTVPVNVANICNWTWMCAPAPVGPNIHANNTGYKVIAKTFEPLIQVPGRHRHRH